MHSWNTLVKHKGTLSIELSSSPVLAESYTAAVVLGVLLKLTGVVLQVDWLISQVYFTYILAWYWVIKSLLFGVVLATDKTRCRQYFFDSVNDLKLTIICVLVVLIKEQIFVLGRLRLSGHLVTAIVTTQLLLIEVIRVETYYAITWPSKLAKGIWVYHLFAIFVTSTNSHTLIELGISLAIGIHLLKLTK